MDKLVLIFLIIIPIVIVSLIAFKELFPQYFYELEKRMIESLKGE